MNISVCFYSAAVSRWRQTFLERLEEAGLQREDVSIIIITSISISMTITITMIISMIFINNRIRLPQRTISNYTPLGPFSVALQKN